MRERLNQFQLFGASGDQQKIFRLKYRLRIGQWSGLVPAHQCQYPDAQGRTQTAFSQGTADQIRSGMHAHVQDALVEGITIHKGLGGDFPDLGEGFGGLQRIQAAARGLHQQGVANVEDAVLQVHTLHSFSAAHGQYMPTPTLAERRLAKGPAGDFGLGPYGHFHQQNPFGHKRVDECGFGLDLHLTQTEKGLF